MAKVDPIFEKDVTYGLKNFEGTMNMRQVEDPAPGGSAWSCLLRF